MLWKLQSVMVYGLLRVGNLFILLVPMPPTSTKRRKHALAASGNILSYIP